MPRRVDSPLFFLTIRGRRRYGQEKRSKDGDARQRIRQKEGEGDMLKRLVTVGVGMAALLAVSAQATTGVSPCTANKIKAAGKKAGSKLTCLSKSLAKGTFPVDSTCLAKAEVKFSGTVAKAEAKVPPTCLSTGDTAAIEAKIDTLVSDLHALTPDALNACDAAKAKAAGKKVAAKLTCHSKAVAK